MIPVRDRTDLLKRCLASIRNQDYPAEKFDIIVCDDGSVSDIDAAMEIQKSPHPKITYVCQERLGPAAARNLGVRESSAPFILFIDSDVVADKGLVRNLVSALLNNQDWAGAEACLLPIDGCSSPLWEAPAAPAGGRYHTAAIAYRRQALRAAGGLDETFLLAACEDVELAARILPIGQIGFVSEAKVYHPRRKVNLRNRWRSRLHWKYILILAERYGFLAFPERKLGRFCRLRIAWSAVVALPIGRLLRALSWLKHNPPGAILACLYALFDVVCGLSALPDILFSAIPERKDYLRESSIQSGHSMNKMRLDYPI